MIRFTLGINSAGDWIIRKDGEFFALYKRHLYSVVQIQRLLRDLNGGAA